VFYWTYPNLRHKNVKIGLFTPPARIIGSTEITWPRY
jgi:hypothetical protein